MKKSVVLLLDIIFLFFVGVQGNGVNSLNLTCQDKQFFLVWVYEFMASGDPIMNRRCLCITTSSKIYPKFIKEIKQYEPTPSCGKTEIIATMKNGAQICLNPDLKTLKKWKIQASLKNKLQKGKYQKINKVSNRKKFQRFQQKKTA